MFQSLRVALTAVVGVLLTAAGPTPEIVTPSVPSLLPAPAVFVPGTLTPITLTPVTASPAPQLDAGLTGDDEMLAVSDADPRPASLTQLVAGIAALPSIELDEDMRCLAVAVYFESKGEPLEGQLAVAQVILNRVAAGRWAGDVCDVVYQRGQFSFTWDRHTDTPREGAAWRAAQAIAVIAETRNWADVARKATHFHATRVAPGWNNLQRVAAIGNHVFYRNR